MKIKHLLMTFALAAATLTATGQTVTTDTGASYAPANLGANALANATTLTISGTWTADQVTKLREAIAGSLTGSNAALTTVTFDASAVMESMYFLFSNCTALTGVTMPTKPNSAAVSFLSAFEGCKALTGTVNLSAFTNISSMNYAFYGCAALEGVTLPDADTAISGGVGFNSAFYGCKALTGTVNLSGFTNISSMNFAFEDCTGITGVKFSATENPATVDFYGTFDGCTALKTVDLSKFTAIPNMTEAFNNCASLTSVKLGGTQPATTTSAFNGVNYNCLVYVPEGWTKPARGWSIIFIAGSTAKGDITLEVDRPFRCPQAFMMAAGSRITYTRNFGTEPSGIDGNAAGWETLCLPFTPTLVRGLNVAGDSVTLAPFHADGTYEGKGTEGIVPFWLRTLGADKYTPATAIEPHKPYIIALPNNETYDRKFNVTGSVTFSAVSTAEAPIAIGMTPDVLPSAPGSVYTLHSTYATVPAAESVYVINTDGTAFVANGGDALPFRPYVTANNPQNAPAQFVIGKDEGGATGIEEAVLMGRSDGNDADGLRVYGSTERGALVVEAVTASTVDVVAIDGCTVRTVSLQEGVNTVNGLAAGVYVVGGCKAVVR